MNKTTSPSIVVGRTFSMVNGIESSNTSFLITGDGRSGIDLSVTVQTGENLRPILNFELRKDFSVATEPYPAIPGRHDLTVSGTSVGILLVNGTAQVIPVPDRMAVLILKGGGAYEWSFPPVADAAFGLKNGAPYWYPVATCEDACTPEETV